MNGKKYVLYSEFGAVGDGVTDDFAALRAAHAYANEHSLPVKADEGKSYYIGASIEGDPITVRTDTDLGGSEIIIDDRAIPPSDTEQRRKCIFLIASDSEPVRHGEDSELVRAINANGGIRTTDKTLPYKPGYTAMLIPYNTERKVYIRYGGNANDGQDQHEVMIIDGEGNIDKDTPALLDYEKVTYVDEIPVSDRPITVEGGTFVTRANSAPRAYTYYYRNMKICRSNVTLRGIKRRITDEGDSGAPYAAFFEIRGANNIVMDACTLQAHRYYYNEDPSTGGPTPMGTYEISAGNSNNVLFKNCRQVNYHDPNTGAPTTSFFDKDGKAVGEGIWGVMGSNYSKNITYDGCILNRYDAHAGVYNATIINSEVIHICLIGGGTARIEGCTIYSYAFLKLRGDFGSFWNGDLIIKDTRFVYTSAPAEEPENCTALLIVGSWCNHYFGYTTALPRITVDNLKVESCDGTPIGTLAAFYDYTECKVGDFTGKTVVIDGEEVENKNPLSLPEFIKVKNCGTLKVIGATPDGWMSENIKISYE